MIAVEQFIAVYFIVTRLQAYSKYYVKENITSWDEANETCVLATPKLRNIHTNKYLQLAEQISLPNGDYWTGYATVDQILEYAACVAWTGVDLQLISRSIEFVDSPGTCYSACKTQLFGIERNKCYCFAGSIWTIRRKFLKDIKDTCTCLDQFWIHCYGVGALALYAVLDAKDIGNVDGVRSSNLCLAYRPEKDLFYWEDCNAAQPTMCLDTDLHQNVETKNGTWHESTNHCTRIGKPVFYFLWKSQFMSQLMASVNYWTSMFRVKLLINLHEEPGIPIVKYHFLRVTDYGVQVMSTYTRESNSAAALCSDNGIATIPQTTNPYTDSGVANTTLTTSTWIRTYAVPLFVGIGVAVFVGICCTIVVVFFCRKRSIPDQKCQESGAQDANETELNEYEIATCEVSPRENYDALLPPPPPPDTDIVLYEDVHEA